MEHPTNSSPHVLIFPLPGQGHITPMLHLSELLCLANIQVTFLIAEDKYQLLTQHSTIHARFDRYPGFRFITIPQAPPNGNPKPASHDVIGLIKARTEALALTGAPILRQLLMESKQMAKVTCIIIDGLLSFAYDIANEAEVPVILFKCVSAACIWSCMCIPQLVQSGELPIKDDKEMDQLVKNAPGLSSFLRYRDMPRFCDNQDKSSCFNLQHVFVEELQRTKNAHSLILNTFEDLEGPLLAQIRLQCPQVYTIGPLHAHLEHRLSKENILVLSNNSSSSLWEVDQGCMSWLDQKPNKSVVYVSFGSATNITNEQFMEIWAGLVESNKYFLWVIRPNEMISNGLEAPTSHGLLEGTVKRGCVVKWAPQDEVLAHRAVGGFLTHSGWNSTLESIVAGVPMLCWPNCVDQQVNSRFVSEVWRIGLDMKDTCDKTIVKNMINDLMDVKKDELENSIDQISQLAKKSVSEGGSSYSNLNHLIDDIKAMTK